MELTKNFEPQHVEQRWTKLWKDRRYFNSIPDSRPPFTVVIPPPNVTGVLHMGHTLNETVQDILIRKARMSGFNACWVPGSDHASIATEAKVVQMLEREHGIRKADLTREEFLRYAYEWKDKYGSIIYSQIERLGCSVDWDRVAFTMDADYYKAVIKVFVDLYKKGLLYRGARMINWDPSARTGLSDEEVEYKDVQGKLYYVKYPLAGEPVKGHPDHVIIATQRPETIMGDTAVCVHPDDERYAYLRGRELVVPLVNRKVPVIFDEYVDKEFGTGALKVTPAHDINDYNLGLKHKLEVIDTLNEDGTLSAAAGVFIGIDRFEARKLAVEQLRNEGLLLKEEEYSTRLGFSQRTSAVVEPRISTQWFVRMKELAAPALKEVLDGRIRIHPGDRFLATYRHWLENVRDWNISRQLWWGQQIPAYFTPDGEMAVAESKEAAFAELKSKNPNLRIEELKQDPDVLDTWFSSWLWPMEVFKGITDPNNKDFNYYYPTSVLVTGQDIIFFWVARMIMAGMEFKNEKPFSDVYFTGMVRDKQGRKMSKSLGNSPDLLNLIDRFGADAVRFGIMISSPAGNDLLFDDSSCEQGRNFNNKIWNALKLVRMWDGRKLAGLAKGDHFAVDWFANRLNEVRVEVEILLKEFRLSEALKVIYSLIWDDFCSWYLEFVKPGFEQPIDAGIYERTIGFFEDLVQLLHPFMPFVTEEIASLLAPGKDPVCIRQFPKTSATNLAILKNGNVLKEVITAIREARGKNQLKPKDTIELSIQTNDAAPYKAIESILARQVNAASVSYVNDARPNAITVVVQKDRFFLETEREVDSASQKDLLMKDLEYLKGFLDSVNKKLNNERFVNNAKPEVVDIEKKKRADAEEKIRTIEESLRN